MVVIIWQSDLQLSMQSVTNTTLNAIHGEVYSIQLYVIKFVSDLLQVDGFLWVLKFPPPIKLTDITEKLLKMVLNTLTLICCV